MGRSGFNVYPETSQVPEILDKPTYLDGEKVLEGFHLSPKNLINTMKKNT
jgi:hypothetical protein